MSRGWMLVGSENPASRHFWRWVLYATTKQGGQAEFAPHIRPGQTAKSPYRPHRWTIGAVIGADGKALAGAEQRVRERGDAGVHRYVERRIYRYWRGTRREASMHTISPTRPSLPAQERADSPSPLSPGKGRVTPPPPSPRRTPKAKKSTRLTPRDFDILAWLYAVRIARPAQVALAMGMGESHVRQRLTDLRRAGLVGVDQRLRGQSAWYATDAALGLLGIDADANRVPALGQWSHELAVAGVSAAYQHVGHPVVTARQIQSAVMSTEHTPARSVRDHPTVAPEALAVPTGTRTLHIPDAAIEISEGWVALEVELSRKRRESLRHVLLGYASTIAAGQHPVRSLHYLTGSEVIARAVRSEAREVARQRGSALDLLALGALTIEPYDPSEWAVA